MVKALRGVGSGGKRHHHKPAKGSREGTKVVCYRCGGEVRINSIPMEIELDMGAALSLISSKPYHKITRASHMEPLVETNVHLQT